MRLIDNREVEQREIVRRCVPIQETGERGPRTSVMFIMKVSWSPQPFKAGDQRKGVIDESSL